MSTNLPVAPLVGADPEVFVFSKDGKFIPAVGMTHGTKAAPHRISRVGAVQVDGVALEYNIKPATTPYRFAMRNLYMYRKLHQLIPPEAEIKLTPFHNIPPEIWGTIPTENRELGCDPEYCAYADGEAVPSPEKTIGRNRTTSGHIHIGWTQDALPSASHTAACCQITKQLEFFLSPIILTYDNTLESSNRRRFYGNFGAFRPKPYGVECRVLSNFWVDKPRLAQKIFKAATYAYQVLVHDGKYFGAASHVNSRANWVNLFNASYRNGSSAVREILKTAKKDLLT